MRYPPAFNEWWNENKHSEELIDRYKNYRLDISYINEKPMSFKRWALRAYQED